LGLGNDGIFIKTKITGQKNFIDNSYISKRNS